MKRMQEAGKSKGRGDTEVARTEDEPVVDFDNGEEEPSAFGMWKDREEMADIDAWVRNLRRGRFDAF